MNYGLLGSVTGLQLAGRFFIETAFELSKQKNSNELNEQVKVIANFLL